MTGDEAEQLAAAAAMGALGPEERARFERFLEANPAARAELARFNAAAAAFAKATAPARTPPPRLRDALLDRVGRIPRPAAGPATPAPAQPPPLPAGFALIAREQPWLAAPLPGGRYKLLSAHPQQPYAVLLLELAPKTRHPDHDHAGPEDLYLLTGDLQTEGRVMRPGDFFHAEPGTHHSELFTEGGCTALLILPAAALAELNQGAGKGRMENAKG